MKTEPKKMTKAAKKFVMGTVVVFAVVGAVVAGLLKAPEFLSKITYKDNQAQILSEKIEKLEKKIMVLERQSQKEKTKDVTDLYAKFDDFARGVNESLALKAQAQDVASLSNQVSILEKNVKASSSQNALILTATGLVENASKSGKPFIYEATVLKGLCQGTELENGAEEISEIAINGIALDQELIQKFEEIYDKAIHQEKQEKTDESNLDTETDWKSFLKNKLQKLIIFEKIEKQEDGALSAEQEVLQLVREGQFGGAVLEMENLQFFQTENFEIWKEVWRTRERFDDLMEKMKAYTLGALKVENLKK